VQLKTANVFGGRLIDRLAQKHGEFPDMIRVSIDGFLRQIAQQHVVRHALSCVQRFCHGVIVQNPEIKRKKADNNSQQRSQNEHHSGQAQAPFIVAFRTTGHAQIVENIRQQRPRLTTFKSAKRLSSTLAVFAVFVASTTYAIITGQSCNCFGERIDPQTMLVIDMIVLLLTGIFRPIAGNISSKPLMTHLVTAIASHCMELQQIGKREPSQRDLDALEFSALRSSAVRP